MDFNWCYTALRPQLGPLDARAVFPLALWMLHWAWWTFYLAVGFIVFLVFLDKKGLPVNVSLLQLRTYILGRYRPVQDYIIVRRRARW
jgi:intracellular multiplication protein IcmT